MINQNWWKLTPLLLFGASMLLLIGGIASGGCGGGGAGTVGGGSIGGGSGTRISGNVLDASTNVGVLAITVQFFDASNLFVGEATTDAAGSYLAQVTAVPASMTLKPSSISAAYYKEYQYKGEWYAPTISSCRAPITGITPSIVNTISNIKIPNTAGPPPPPPTGCN